MENVIIVPSYKSSEQVLLEEQNIWSAVFVAEEKVKELKYLVVYRVKDNNYDFKYQWTLFGTYKIVWYVKISDELSKEDSIKDHKNYGKYIFFVEKFNEIHKKSPRVYQDRDYMNYEDFKALSDI